MDVDPDENRHLLKFYLPTLTIACSMPFVEASFKRIRDLDHLLPDCLLNTDKSYFLKVLHNNFDDNDIVVFCWQSSNSSTPNVSEYPRVSGPLGRNTTVEAGYSEV